MKLYYVMTRTPPTPWFNNQIKALIEKKNSSKTYWSIAKHFTSSKTYWSIMKTFVNSKKTPIIPPLLVNNNLISNFREKANIFNNFFVQQCQSMANNSILLTNQIFYTQNRLRDFDIDRGEISKLINGLNSCKAHGHHGISVRMVKLCKLTMAKPLPIIYKNCLQQGAFPDEWKKGNIIPVHKKNSKQIVDNYRPVSLSPICSKIFEKLIFDSIYEYLNKNNLFNNNQLVSRPNGSCIHQFIAITQNTFSVFDANHSLEVRDDFLNLYKAFGRVWHDSHLYKLKSNGIDGNLFKLIKSFLNNRCQRVVSMVNLQSGNRLQLVWHKVQF